VSCNEKDIVENGYWYKNWKFNHAKVGNHQVFLKSGDIINLSIKSIYQYEFLRSHDIQFNIGNNTFQEVVCHNERLGGIDEVNKLQLIL
jgi:hypothetical protein